MVKTMTQFSVHTKNRLGAMAKLTQVLVDSDVNIVAIFAPDTQSDYGTLRVVPDKPDAAKKALDEIGYPFTPVDVLVMELPHRPGSLAHIANLLAENDLFVRYAYASIQPGAQTGLFILRLDDMEKGRELLEGV